MSRGSNHFRDVTQLGTRRKLAPGARGEGFVYTTSFLVNIIPRLLAACSTHKS